MAAERAGLPRATAKALSVSIFYGMSSLLLGLVNKTLLSIYNFNGYFTFLAVQMFMSWVMCVVSRDYYGNPFGVPTYDPAMHRAALSVGVFYVVNVGAGLIGLQMVNVPMFFCIRRLVTPTVLVYEYLTLGKVADPNIQVAVGVIMLGTIVAGWDSLNADLLGYGITMLNNLLTAGASVAQKQFADTSRVSAFGVLYYNACTAAPLAAFLSVVTGELLALPSFPHSGSLSFWISFLFGCALGPLLTYSSMLCTTFNSPLATSVTGNVKDLAQTILGGILFPGFVATIKTISGLVLSFMGAGMYSYINLSKGMAAKTLAPVAAATAASVKAEQVELGLEGGAESSAGDADERGADERVPLRAR